MDSKPPYAALALSLTVQEWDELGLDPSTAPTDDLEVLIDRVTSLLLLRVVAQCCDVGSDLSTSNICRNSLMRQDESWPSPVTSDVVGQVRQFVRAILKGYRDVPYHNAKHAHHVVLSTNKLIDMMWMGSDSYGLRRDALALTALIFAAVIHDVEHQGVPNRQLTAEDDELAVLYNDQSIAENRSLCVGFFELLKPDYELLRKTLFKTRDEYLTFRRHVVNLVLNTDIASPERTQLFKSKWKEAFPPEDSNKRRLSYSSVNDNSSSVLKGLENDDYDEDDDGMLMHVRRSRSEEGNTAPEEKRSKFPRAKSAPESRSFRQRLGIRMSMDLSGEAIEAFSSHSNESADGDDNDELRKSVVMECIITAADVGHNLQGWKQMCYWSARLYNELRKAYVEGRGGDASPKWFENQIGFLESYLMLLAQRLEDTCVFGLMGPRFMEIVTASRDRWLLEGLEIAETTVSDGNKAFPN